VCQTDLALLGARRGAGAAKSPGPFTEHLDKLLEEVL
jgi:hypothetical protein